MPSLKSVTIQASVKSIGDNAFYFATGLTSLTFAANSQLIFIGNYAFCYASSLRSINIPNSVTNIGDYAFQDASSLTSIIFAANSKVANIGQQSFQNTARLTSITIPASVNNIGSYAFLGSGLTTVIFESTINLESLGFKISNAPQKFYGQMALISPSRSALTVALNQAQTQLNLDETALAVANTAYNNANTEVLDAEFAIVNAEIDYNIAYRNFTDTTPFSANYQTVYNEYLNASKKKEEANKKVTNANNDLRHAQQTQAAAEQARTQTQARVQTLTDAQSWALV